MRILAVNWLDLDNPQAGGAELHFFEIFGRLSAWGNEVTLITSGWTGAEPEATIRGIRIRRVGGRHTFALKGRGAVRRALESAEYDVLVEDVNKLPLYLPGITRLPLYVIVPHLFGTTAFREASWPVASVVWLAERWIPRGYARAEFHAISESTRDDLAERGVSPERIRVIHPGVDTEGLTPEPETRAREPVFLYVGRLKRYKGVETAIRAVHRARESGYPVLLNIAGQGDDRDRLERLVSRLDLGALVRFLGFVEEPEKLRLLREAWAVVFPSAKEGWGLVNVEAAACGTPALAADRPGLRESVRDGVTGYLLPHGDVEAWGAAMVRLAADPALVAGLGSNARAFAETFSWDTAARETAEHLASTLSANRRTGKE